MTDDVIYLYFHIRKAIPTRIACARDWLRPCGPTRTAPIRMSTERINVLNNKQSAEHTVD